MYIQYIKLQNYKAFQNLEISDLPKLAVFVGANGAGKSTFFDVFGFLSDALHNNITHALNKRGGFKEVISRASKNRYIQIEIKFRIKLVEKSRLVTYILRLEEREKKPVIAREILRYKRGSSGKPFHFLDFSMGEGNAINNEEMFDKKDEELEREEQILESPDILAIKGLGQFTRFKAASAFRSFIDKWYVSDFHISHARSDNDAGYAEHLSSTGGNLPLVAHYMYENHKEIFDEILKKMASRVPGITNVKAMLTADGRIVLSFSDDAFKDPFIARYVSDGTIKMFAYLILLHDPHPHPLFCIEEPENQLYPHLLKELMEEFRIYAQKQEGQVFITSHSPDLLNAAELEEVFWLVKEKGYTIVKRASADEMIRGLVQNGDKLGFLWRQDYFQGIKP